MMVNLLARYCIALENDVCKAFLIKWKMFMLSSREEAKMNGKRVERKTPNGNGGYSIGIIGGGFLSAFLQ